MTFDRRIEPTDRNPFIDANAPTFSDAIAQITADTSLTPARRRDLVSAIRCLMRLLGLDPATQAERDFKPMFRHPRNRILNVNGTPWNTRTQPTPNFSPFARLRLDCRSPSEPCGGGSVTEI